ncbi:MAG TPA: hypothetical protein VNZ49_12465 [Bacteroidia bacterium]|jgi:hypothetical protein|nr:hypothetical protein [Bacteroidia bacterium]
MKYILLFIHALTISIYSLFFGDPVSVKTNFPESAKPGTEFTAEITINKGDIAGFAKLQLELPQGFSAKEGDSKGGAFSLAGQTAKIIWTSVPSSAEFVVKMTIVVDASANGDKIVTGKYSYIENNNKQQSEFTPVTVKIISDGAVTNTEPVATNTIAANTGDSLKKSFTKPDEVNTVVSAVRTITPSKKPDVYDVELKIKKEAIKGFAKIQEKLPAGFIATGQKTDGSSFSFSSADHIAKFIWTSLPSQEELIISYKIMPKQGAAIEKPAGVEGEFSYLENQQSKTYIIQKQNLEGGAEPVATNTVEPVSTNTVANTEPVNTNTFANTEPVNTNTVANTEPVKTETTTTQTEPVNTQKNNNVHYSVQVGAFKNGVSVAALSSKYSLTGVSTEMQDGYTKCITGKHSEYKSARDERETIKSKGVTDAFVTAYNTGRRITVQEALMITSQKWFR